MYACRHICLVKYRYIHIPYLHFAQFSYIACAYKFWRHFMLESFFYFQVSLWISVQPILGTPVLYLYISRSVLPPWIKGFQHSDSCFTRLILLYKSVSNSNSRRRRRQIVWLKLHMVTSLLCISSVTHLFTYLP